MTAPAAAYDAAQDPAYELLGLLAAEFAEGGIESRVLPGDDEVPAQLVVPLEDDDGRASTVHVCFLPDHAEPAVLQYLAVVDHEVLPQAIPQVARFLHLVNSTLPLTGFELGESVPAVVFRHNQAVSVRPLDPAVVAWSLSMIHHALTRFGPLVGEACAGASIESLVSGYGRVMADFYAPAAEGREDGV